MKKMMSHGISGLPDGLFSTPPPGLVNFGGSMNGHLVNFLAICFILRKFAIFCGHIIFVQTNL
jgi:hypothetical protein